MSDFILKVREVQEVISRVGIWLQLRNGTIDSVGEDGSSRLESRKPGRVVPDPGARMEGT